MRSYLHIVRLFMGKRCNLDGTPVPKPEQTVFVEDIQDELYCVLCVLRFIGNKDLCYWSNVRKDYSWNRILQDTVNKFRYGKYDNLAIYRKNCYYG